MSEARTPENAQRENFRVVNRTNAVTGEKVKIEAATPSALGRDNLTMPSR